MERTFKQKWSCRALKRFIKSIKYCSFGNHFLCNNSFEFQILWRRHLQEILNLRDRFLAETGRPQETEQFGVLFNKNDNANKETRIAFLRYEIARLTRERKQLQ